MKLPIDTTTAKFAASGPAEPALDFETKATCTDESGTPCSVPGFASGVEVSDSILNDADSAPLAEGIPKWKFGSHRVGTAAGVPRRSIDSRQIPPLLRGHECPATTWFDQWGGDTVSENRAASSPVVLVADQSERALMDLAQSATYLGTSERHVRRLWQERRIAVVKVGRRVRFLRSDLDAFIEKNHHDALR